MDQRYRDQVSPITADKRDRVIPASNLRKLVLALDNARDNAHYVVHGDFLFADRDSTGSISVRLNSTGEDAWPLTAQDGVEDVPLKEIFVSNDAQAGKVLNLWYGYRARMRAGANSIASIGSILNPVGLDPEYAKYFLFGDDETDDNEAFSLGVSQAGVVGQSSQFQIKNPAASPNTVYVHRAWVQNLAVAANFGVSFHDADLATDAGAGLSLASGGAAAQAHVRSGAGVAVVNQFRSFSVANGFDREIVFLPAVKLAPGRGIVLTCSAINTAIAGGFVWREYV